MSCLDYAAGDLARAGSLIPSLFVFFSFVIFEGQGGNHHMNTLGLLEPVRC
jgi:hypothetical protein